MLIVGIFLAIILTRLAFGLWGIHSVTNPSWHDWLNILLANSRQVNLAILGLCLFLGVFLVNIIYWCLRILLDVKKKNKIVKYTFSVLSIIGLVILAYVGYSLVKDFSEEAKYIQNISIKQVKSDTLFLNLKTTDYTNNTIIYKKSNFPFGHYKLIFDNEKIMDFLKVDIIPAETDSFELVAYQLASGNTRKEATFRAKNISYQINQDNSLMVFDPHISFPIDDKWRSQQVKLVLKVPKNKVIYMDKSMKKVIYDIDNVSNTLDRDMVRHYWIMRNEGLTCMDCYERQSKLRKNDGLE